MEVLGSLPASLSTRYPDDTPSLLSLNVPADWRECVGLTTSKEAACKELEGRLRVDCGTACNRLAPIEAAIKSKDRSDAACRKAAAEADGGSELVAQALDGLPSTLAADYPHSHPLLEKAPPTPLAESAELGWVPQIRELTEVAGGVGTLAKDVEAVVRADAAKARAEARATEAALKAEERRQTNLSKAAEAADAGGKLLTEALGGLPASLATRYADAARSLRLHVQVPIHTYTCAGAHAYMHTCIRTRVHTYASPRAGAAALAGRRAAPDHERGRGLFWERERAGGGGVGFGRLASSGQRTRALLPGASGDAAHGDDGAREPAAHRWRRRGCRALEDQGRDPTRGGARLR